MEYFYLSWKKTLNELNDFSCKVEFLQSKIRNDVVSKNNLNINEYMISLIWLIRKHFKNLNLIAKLNNYNVIDISSIKEHGIEGNKKLKEEFNIQQ